MTGTGSEVKPEKVGYLVLRWGPMATQIAPVAQKATKSIGIDLSLLKVKFDRSEDNRWFIRFEDDQEDGERAGRYADAIHCLFSASYTSLPDRLQLFRIPLNLVKNGSIAAEALETLDENGDTPPLGLPSLLERMGIPASAEAYIWACLPATEEERILRALAFLAESHKAVEFSPGAPYHFKPLQTGEAPSSMVDLVQLETALHAAHKAVEAIVGEPRKDEKRFWWALKRLGFKPDEMVGYEIKAPLRKKIKEMTQARDGRAAHGSYPRTWPLTWVELRDWQACAKHLVFSSILFKLPELEKWLEKDREDAANETP